ncbi:MAG: RNA polymerase sigma factor [Planctomycetota bacterium]|nr:MAG: RNA polymerase sigma factor [Planctomycetota bacterium]
MAELADRLARGDPAAFAELYDACAAALHHWLLLQLRSANDADDVVQETFVRLARSRKKLRRVENPVAYAFTVARNEAARLQRRRVRKPRGEAELPALASVDDASAEREAVDAVRAALERLPKEQREIVELKAYAGLTLREIAEVTSLPPGTVATRYRAALGRLRQWLIKSECHE